MRPLLPSGSGGTWGRGRLRIERFPVILELVMLENLRYNPVDLACVNYKSWKRAYFKNLCTVWLKIYDWFKRGYFDSGLKGLFSTERFWILSYLKAKPDPEGAAHNWEEHGGRVGRGRGRRAVPCPHCPPPQQEQGGCEAEVGFALGVSLTYLSCICCSCSNLDHARKFTLQSSWPYLCGPKKFKEILCFSSFVLRI